MKEGRVLQLLEYLEMFLYRKATAIVPVTNVFKVGLMTQLIDSRKIAIVINGVDLASYFPRDRDQDLESPYR